MNNINAIVLEGRIKSIEEHQSGNVSLIIEVERFYRDATGEKQSEISEFEIECRGDIAKFCKAKAKAGRMIRCVGRLARRVWNDGEKKHAKIVVIAKHIEFKL